MKREEIFKFIGIDDWQHKKKVSEEHSDMGDFRKTLAIIKYTFAVIGLILLSVFIWLFIGTTQFIEQGIVTTGTVIRYEGGSSGSFYGRSTKVFHPVVEFSTVSGRTVQFTSKTGSSNPSYRRGEEVEVIYRTSYPNDAKIKSFMGLWFGSLIFRVKWLVVPMKVLC